MLFVANQFTEQEGKERYLAAAKAFRMPFWGEWSFRCTIQYNRGFANTTFVDWARPDLVVFPDEATDSNVVRVIMPEELRKAYKDLKEADGSVEIPNPLYAYKFQRGAGEEFKVSE